MRIADTPVHIRVRGYLYLLPTLPFRLQAGMGRFLPPAPAALALQVGRGRVTMVPFIPEA